MTTINNIECADYNDGSFWQKVKRYCKDIGKGSLESVFRLYCALDSEKCSAADRAIIYGALAYLVSPIDLIPDLTPFIGYTDDMALITAALSSVVSCIDSSVKAKARSMINEIFN